MKSLYILQVTKQKLTHESFKTLKSLLHYILGQDSSITDIIIEVYFEEEDFGLDLSLHITSIV